MLRYSLRMEFFTRGVANGSPVKKRSIVIRGHKTSVSLEDAFWQDLQFLAQYNATTLSDLIGQIDRDRQHANLSSAIRIHVLEHYRSRVRTAERRSEYIAKR